MIRRLPRIVDLQGSLGRFADFTTTRRRLYDTRNNTSPLRAGHLIRVSKLTAGKVYALNLTAVAPTGSGYLTAYPCAAGRPSAWSVYYQRGEVKAGAVMVKADNNGRLCVYTSDQSHVIDTNEAQHVLQIAARKIDIAAERHTTRCHHQIHGAIMQQAKRTVLGVTERHAGAADVIDPDLQR